MIRKTHCLSWLYAPVRVLFSGSATLMLSLSCLSCVRLLPLLTILRDDLQRITLQTVPFPVSSAGKSAVNSASCSCCAWLILLSCSMISRTGQSQEKRTALSVPCLLLLTLAESVSVFSPCVRQTGDSPSVCSALWDLLSVCPAPADGSGQQTLCPSLGVCSLSWSLICSQTLLLSFQLSGQDLSGLSVRLSESCSCPSLACLPVICSLCCSERRSQPVQTNN